MVALFHHAFEAVWNIKIGYVLCGVIWSVACGFAVGNYACSLVHRLPRGKLILDKTPYCGNCGTLLQTRDLFPVFSALMLRHRCRYCKQPFPVSHTWTELLVGLLFVLTFMRYNFGQEFILIAALGVFWIVLAAIDANENRIMRPVVLCILVFAMLTRVLMDASIYGVVQGALFGGLVSAIFYKNSNQKVGHIFVPPPQVIVFTLGAICAGGDAFGAYVALFLAITVVLGGIAKLRAKRPLISVYAGLAGMLLVLYSGLDFFSTIQP